jgi:hypothetical protein
MASGGYYVATHILTVWKRLAGLEPDQPHGWSFPDAVCGNKLTPLAPWLMGQRHLFCFHGTWNQWTIVCENQAFAISCACTENAVITLKYPLYQVDLPIVGRI